MAILITIYICPERNHSPFSLVYSWSLKNNQVFLDLKNTNRCIFPFSYCAPLVSFLKLLQSRGCIHSSNETAPFKIVEDIVCIVHHPRSGFCCSCCGVMKTHFSGRAPLVERTLLLVNTGLSRIGLYQWLIDVGLKRPGALSQDSSAIHSLELSPELS